MSSTLRPYPDYKPSSTHSLGEIPAYWQLARIKDIFREVDVRSGDGSGTLLSLTRARGLIRHSEATNRLPSAEDLANYKVCRPGQLVMNRMQAWSGMFGTAREEGLVSPDYSVFDPRDGVEVAYFEYLFKTPLYVHEFARRSKGVGTGFNRLYTPDFGAIHIGVPAKQEQQRILSAVNTFGRQIDRLILTKRRLIELLNEQKQIIIHQAVTRGLDPNVCLKPSGLEWIGDIPAHWSVSRLKFIASHIVDCLHATPEYSPDGQYPAIRTADIEPGHVNYGSAKRVTQEQFRLWTSRLAPQAGDILYTREGERYGLAAVVPNGVDLCISQRMMVFRLREPSDSEYVMWQLNCPHVYDQASEDLIGATSPHVNVERIRNYALLIPPPQEQAEIASWISDTAREFDAMRTRAKREIDLLREYRTRLIADVVTGKLDVRGVELPALDEADVPDAWDSDEDAEIDDLSNEEEVDADE